MAQTFTNNPGTVFAGVGRDYPMQMGIGRIGELADISSSATPYQEGIAPNDAVNILKVGAIYIDCWESLAPGNALRYFKSGTNAGRWGKTASAGNSLLFSAGGWEIERPAAAGGLAILRINTPAGLVVTAD
jgi:hypothetical protein